MYITFDYKCPKCGHEESRLVKRDDMNSQTCDHPGLPSWHQSAQMKRLPAGTRTTFRFADTKLKD